MSKIEEAQEILRALGMPTAQQNEISALTFLALCGIGPTDEWKNSKRKALSITKGIMAFMEKVYGKTYAPNTRETVRRQVLHQFVQANIADYNPFEPDLPTNSPRAHYTISEDALSVVKSFQKRQWNSAILKFKNKYGSLIDLYNMPRLSCKLIPVKLPSGQKLNLSPGKHNLVQKAIIEEFAPRFAPNSYLLYWFLTRICARSEAREGLLNSGIKR